MWWRNTTTLNFVSKVWDDKTALTIFILRPATDKLWFFKSPFGSKSNSILLQTLIPLPIKLQWIMGELIQCQREKCHRFDQTRFFLFFGNKSFLKYTFQINTYIHNRHRWSHTVQAAACTFKNRAFKLIVCVKLKATCYLWWLSWFCTDGCDAVSIFFFLFSNFLHSSSSWSSGCGREEIRMVWNTWLINKSYQIHIDCTW